MTDWFRSWHGAPTDPKWLGIARRAGVAPGIVVAAVWSLMDRASQAEDRGSITGYDAEGMACFFGCDPEAIEAIVAAMSDKGMIVNGRFASWEKRQPKREDDSSQRVREHRERKRAQSERDETHCNAPEKIREEQKEEDNKAIALSSDPVAEMVEVYHEAMAPAGCPRVLKITPSRKASALQRLKDCGGMDGWRHAMAKARASPFLTGVSANGWKADFDFFMQAKSFTKLLEGSYDARKPSGTVAQPKPLTGSSALLAAARSRLGPIPDGGGGEAGIPRGLDAQRDGSGVYRLADRGH
jgi:hypothetical protein